MESDFARDQAAPRPSADEARAALDGLDADGARLAERVITPLWYHPILGVILAALVAGPSLFGGYQFYTVLPCALGIIFLQLAYRRTTGVAVTGAKSRRGRTIYITLLVIVGAAFFASLALWIARLDPLWSLIPAAVAFFCTILLGRAYDAALRREFAAGHGRTAVGDQA